jgi:hypothetical protein
MEIVNTRMRCQFDQKKAEDEGYSGRYSTAGRDWLESRRKVLDRDTDLGFISINLH